MNNKGQFKYFMNSVQGPNIVKASPITLINLKIPGIKRVLCQEPRTKIKNVYLSPWKKKEKQKFTSEKASFITH